MIRRSQLYVPSISEKMIRKSVELNADSIIFDLEDAVPPEDKERAREILIKLIKELDWGKRELCVRINSLQLSESFKDLATISKEEKITCIVVPKTENDLSFLFKATGKTLIPLIETAKGIAKIEDIVRSEGVEAISYGIADLSLSLGGDFTFYEKNEFIKTYIVNIAKAYDVDAIDKVYFDLKNQEGFRKECEEARKLGYVGKQVIHPSQVEIANQVFSPSKEEIEWARRVIEAYEKAKKEGRGAIRLDDKLVDYVHYKIAKRIIEFQNL
ncbi:citryl-CoA lyase [Sulfolobus sp. A20]|uniref:HpcH/HpaI aldolase/citrate lyase family protein n=2 Tax=Sulfolobaceae TaxID=118883 RepID=UPI000845E437|nr:CoA ester lyase [Sulfolobus sp. A20]TRM74371.1 CoA ester lyase [Sulfolobus sp. B5]TRM80406.1 CoA ester lyase [Sulfolobus sp. D5]TRM83990.1 CoA ester lyase [Sulfolobus sp. A20-N-F6]TRM86839.1 CoA ester lyase [Sulfolobus sp. C3]TRM99343.1 CoA ester lyase [Sulfolobus sp. E1]TRN04158.1 CoA ester lyase [Sulfolobus sp. F1]